MYEKSPEESGEPLEPFEPETSELLPEPADDADPGQHRVPFFTTGLDDDPEYYKIRSWESQKLYERLGVRGYYRALMAYVRRQMPNYDEQERDYGRLPGVRDGLSREAQLQQAIGRSARQESAHVRVAVFYNMTFAAMYAGYETAAESDATDTLPEMNTPVRIGVLAAFGAIQLCANAYPVLLQRYTRLRAERTLAKLQARDEEPRRETGTA